MQLHDNPIPHRPDDTPTKEDRGRKPTPAMRLLAQGATSLDDRELMALVLGEKIRASLNALLYADPGDLVASRTLSPLQAAKLAGAHELCRRLGKAQREQPKLTTAWAVWNHVRPTLVGQRREVFRVLCLDTRSRVLRDVAVAEGSVDSCHVDPREVFGPAIACRASGVVLVHNHPSGDPEPSTQDIELTHQLASGAALLCLRVVDHIVVTETGFVSMKQRQVF